MVSSVQIRDVDDWVVVDVSAIVERLVVSEVGAHVRRRRLRAWR